MTSWKFGKPPIPGGTLVHLILKGNWTQEESYLHFPFIVRNTFNPRGIQLFCCGTINIKLLLTN